MSKALIPRQGTAITVQERELFLDTLRTTFNVSKAAATIGRNRTSLYKLRQTHPEFATAWDEVIEQCLDDVEGVVYERALEGKQPVNNIFLLRHRRAHIYGEKVKVESDVHHEVIVQLFRSPGSKLGPEYDDFAPIRTEEVVDAEVVDEK